MESQFLNKYRTLNSGTRAQMVGSIRNFVKNDQFVNMVSGLNVNDIDPKNKTKPDNIYFVCSQMTAFASIPNFKEEVKMWLNTY